MIASSNSFGKKRSYNSFSTSNSFQELTAYIRSIRISYHLEFTTQISLKVDALACVSSSDWKKSLSAFQSSIFDLNNINFTEIEVTTR